jgi:hypothetical protein
VKTSTLARSGVSAEMVALIARLVNMIPWPARRRAMGDVTSSLLDAKPRVAEDVFGWYRKTVELGLNEVRTGIVCVNDLSTRHKPKTEEKDPELLTSIRAVMEPSSEAESRLRTTFLYTDMTAETVYDALIQGGRSEDSLPTVRTISNILNRAGYRLRTVAKTKVQKNGGNGRHL